jgi:hypothetical protein
VAAEEVQASPTVWSGERRARAPDDLAAESGDEFQCWAGIGGQGGLGRNPLLGMVQWLVEPVAPMRPALDDSAIDQEQQHRNSPCKRGFRPVRRTRQVVFKVKTGVTHGLFDKRLEVLVVPMAPVAGQRIGPLPGEVSDG